MAAKEFASEITALAALGDPVRRELYEFVRGQSHPVSRDMAAVGTEVPRHVAKFHLDKLEEEGLLEVEYMRPSGRSGPGAGRPTKYYRRTSREISVSLPERHYDLAARLLAQAITDSQEKAISIALALERAAKNFGKTLAQDVKVKLKKESSKAKTIEAISEVLADYGYEPKLEQENLLLANCPFHSLAQEYTALICGINHNLMSSLLGELPSSLKAELDPAIGRCCVTLNER